MHPLKNTSELISANFQSPVQRNYKVLMKKFLMEKLHGMKIKFFMLNFFFLATTFAKIICAIIFFVGLFACLAAHGFFLVETLLLGLLSGGVVFYVILTNYTTTSEVFLMSIIGGLSVGAMFALLWQYHSRPILSVLLATATLGYVVAAITFVPLTGEFFI